MNRTTKTTAQARAAKTVVDGDKVRDETPKERLQREWAEAHGADTQPPALGRWFVSQVAGLAGSLAVGTGAWALVDLAIAACVGFTGAALLALMIWIIGLVLTVYASFKAYDVVSEFIYRKQYAAVFDAVSGRVTSLFGGKREVAA